MKNKVLVKSILCSLAAVALMLNLLPFSFKISAATEFTNDETFEAEQAPHESQFNQYVDATGVTGMSGASDGHIMYGNNRTLKKGNYKVVLYATLVSDTGTDANQNIMNWNPGGNLPQHAITRGDFQAVGTVSTITIPFTVTVDSTEIEVRFFYWADRKATVHVDKAVLMNAAAEPIKIVEAENASSSSGTKDSTGIIGTPSDKNDHIIWGNNTTLNPGTVYKMVVYAKLLNNNCVGDKTKTILNYDGSNPNVAITGADFPTANQYYAIEVPIDMTTATAAISPEVRFWYFPASGASIKIDKVIVMLNSDPAPAPTQEFGPYTYEAESSTSSTGTKDSTGIVGKPTDAKDYILTGNSQNLEAGNYKLVVYAKLQDNNCVNTDTKILSFDGLTTAVNITGKSFTKANSYYAIEIPITLTASTQFDLKFMYYPESGATVKIDKLMLMSATVTPPAPIPDFTPKTYEAETAPHSTGYSDLTGAVCTPMFPSNHLIWGNNTTVGPGSYKLVVYAKLLDDNGVGSASTKILNFDAIDGQSKVITGADFPTANQYYAIEIPITAESNLTFEIRLWYFADSKASVKIDKEMLMYATDPTPTAVQEVEKDPSIPSGVTPVDSKNFTITPENVPIKNDSTQSPTASISNGSIYFSTQVNTGGGTDTSKENIYVNSGEKVMRFYVRMLEKAPDGATLLKLYLMKYNGDLKLAVPDTVYAVTSTPFKNVSYNDMVIIDIPFTAKSCYGYTFKIDWTGKTSMSIDRVEITDPDAPAYTGQDIAATVNESNGVYTSEVTGDTVKSMGAFDKVAISAGNVTYKLSYAVVNTYIMSGGKLKVVISDISSDDRSSLDGATKFSKIMTKGYDAYKVDVTAYNASGQQVTYTPNKGNAISIKASDSTLADDSKDNMYGMIFDKDQYTITPSTQKLDTKTQTVTYSAPGSGIYVIGTGTAAFIASLTSQYDKDFPAKADEPDYNNGGNGDNGGNSPLTGYAMNMAILLLAVSAAAVVYGTKKSKANKA